jgi:hypothetical protein
MAVRDALRDDDDDGDERHSSRLAPLAAPALAHSSSVV